MEYYLTEGKYVVFYHEDGINNVSDLSLEGKLVVAVKGVSSLNKCKLIGALERIHRILVVLAL